MPRKLRKTTVVQSSDDEEVPTAPSTPRGSIEAAFARANSKGGSVISVSPTKPIGSPLSARKTTAKSSKRKAPQPSSQSNSPAVKGKSKDKSIQSFFNAATEKIQQSGSVASKKAESLASPPLDLVEDIIEDDSDTGQQKAPIKKPLLVLGRKRKADEIEEKQTGPLSFSQGSHKFLKPNSKATSAAPSSRGTSISANEETRPWTDQYGPVNIGEIAVHKKKVQDVCEWLTKTTTGKERKRLLVLKGGAGTGKTATVKLLSQQLGLKLTEWRNPDLAGGLDGYASIASQFEDFIARTSVFGTLSFDEAKLENASSSEPAVDKHLILVEEFPNTFSKSSSTLQSFRRAVTQYLSTATLSIDSPFSKSNTSTSPVVPVVMIISETLLSTTTASADSFTAHRLLGPEILNHPGTTVMEFNRIAPTFMSKALDLVLRKEATRSGRTFGPGPAVLKHLSETGDVRSAISALEFFCLHQGGADEWSGRIHNGKAKKPKIDAALTSMERQSLQMITQRESTLGIFHAVGKVVYNKREVPSATDTPPPQPPSYFPQHARPKASEVNIESLINELGTDISIFIAALHENYVLSCGGLTEEDTLDTVNGCIDSLSDSDLLSPDRFSNGHSRYSFRGTTIDSLRQDEISFETSVRGILFNLPSPVQRAAPPTEYSSNRGKGSSKAFGHQMLYPTSLRLWRRKEHLKELVNLFNEKFRNGQFNDTFRIPNKPTKPGGVDAWARHARFSGSVDQTPSTASSANGGEAQAEALLLVRGAGKSELLLERLPYISVLERRKPSSTRSAMFKQLVSVTSFSGLTSILANEDEEPEVEELPAEQWSTDKPGEDGRQDWKKSVGVISTAPDGHVVVKKSMESLVLEDDDIEDD